MSRIMRHLVEVNFYPLTGWYLVLVSATAACLLVFTHGQV